MGTRMWTTLDMADGLLIEAKRVAAERRITLRALVEEALERALFAEAHETGFRLRDATVDGRGAGQSHELTDAQRTAAMYGDPTIPATTCLTLGVEHLVTIDRDFSRFPQLVTKAPFG